MKGEPEMSMKRSILIGGVVALAFVGGVVQGQTERFELEGNLKFFGAGNGIIFTDGTKQTSAGVGTANDLRASDVLMPLR